MPSSAAPITSCRASGYEGKNETRDEDMSLTTLFLQLRDDLLENVLLRAGADTHLLAVNHASR